jgi:hypothetical protein
MSRNAFRLVLVLSVASSGFARADGDVLGARSLAVGESLRAAATGSLATHLNPAGVALARSYVIEGGYGYRPDDKSHIQAVSLCDSVTSRVAACLYYNHLSADPTEEGDRSLHEFGITTAVPLGSSLALGVTNRYVSYSESVMEEVPFDSSKKGLLFDAGILYRVIPSLSLAFVGYNLIGADDARYARALGFGAAFTPAGRLTFSADGRYDFGTDSARWGGGAEYLFSGADAQQGIPIRAGYVYDAETSGSFITAGAGFVTPRVALDIGARKQVASGDELMLQLSLRLFLPN